MPARIAAADQLACFDCGKPTRRPPLHNPSEDHYHLCPQCSARWFPRTAGGN